MTLMEWFGYITICSAVGVIGAFVIAFAWFTLRDKQRAREYNRRKTAQGAHGAYEESDAVRFLRESYARRQVAKRTFHPVKSFTVQPGDDINEILAEAEKNSHSGMMGT